MDRRSLLRALCWAPLAPAVYAASSQAGRAGRDFMGGPVEVLPETGHLIITGGTRDHECGFVLRDISCEDFRSRDSHALDALPYYTAHVR